MWFSAFSLPLLPFLVLMSSAVRADAADRFILRNLDIVHGHSAKTLDEDGVVLDSPLADGRTRLTWDEIERGKVAVDQARFDVLLKELGLPLYRVRQRLKLGDVRGAGEVAEGLYERYCERRSQTAYLVCQAVMWSRLAAGRNEEAVEAAVRCFELLRSKAATLAELPGQRRPQFDMETGLAMELPPVWFDANGAKAALVNVERAIRTMAQPRPVGAYVYYATLAAAAGANDDVERVMPLLATQDSSTSLGDLVRAEQELMAGSPGAAVERLRLSRGGLPAACRSAANFVLGRADLTAEDEDPRRDGLLELLSIPAEHSDEQRELSAAALYYAAEGLEKLGDAADALAVRAELAAKYGDLRLGVPTAGGRKK